MDYILLDNNKYVIQTSSIAHEGWVKIEEDVRLLLDNAQFLDCCRYIDGQLIYDQEKHQNYLDDIKKREEELASIPTPQQEIEKLREEIERIKNEGTTTENKPQQIFMRSMMQAPAVMRMATPYVLDDEVEAVADYIPPWDSGGITYNKGEVLSYNGRFYRVLQAHTSQPSWELDNAPSLYVEIGNPTEEWPLWQQPTGAHNAYNISDKVVYKGKRYISQINENTTIPGSDERWWKLP